MSVISAGIVNREGRLLMARQFLDISRVRAEGFLSAFPRLLEASTNKQATFIDAGSVRYVFEPLEDLFLVLVTKNDSNIVEDLETLHLLGRLVHEYLPSGVTDSSVESHAFELFFAFDEVVVVGKREAQTIERVHVYLEMDSHEERMAIEAKKQQLANAKRITAERAKEMQERRRAGMLGGGGGSYGGIGSDDLPGASYDAPGRGMYGGGMSGMGGMGSMASQPQPTSAVASYASPEAPRSGMSLGQARKADLTSKVQREMGIPAQPQGGAAAGAQSTAAGAQTAAAAAAAAGPSSTTAQEAIHVVVEEKYSALLTRDGEATAQDIKGELTLLVNDPQMRRVKLRLAPVSSRFAFKAHTKINKALFASDHVLTMAEGSPFPLQQPVTILRWRMDHHHASEIEPPITFSCWPETGSITIEYEVTSPQAPSLTNVQVAIPLNGAAADQLTASVGTSVVQNGYVIWTIPVVNAQTHNNGNIEITLADDNVESAFFPVQVAFVATTTMGAVVVQEVTSTDTGLPARFSQETRFVAENYQIQ